MERLTEKVNDYYVTNDKAHIYYLDTNESFYVGNAVDKLGELEDVLEEYKIESAEELEDYLSPKLLCYPENLDELKKYCQSEPFIHIDTCEPQIELVTDKVKDLQHQLAVKDKIIELAIQEELSSLGVHKDSIIFDKEFKEVYTDYLIQAEKELKDE